MEEAEAEEERAMGTGGRSYMTEEAIRGREGGRGGGV